MLYGDDDTFFFLDNILELLQDFDPDMPYIITGEQFTVFYTLHYCCTTHLMRMEKRSHTLSLELYCTFVSSMTLVTHEGHKARSEP